jgi:hypothetical protein
MFLNGALRYINIISESNLSHILFIFLIIRNIAWVHKDKVHFLKAARFQARTKFHENCENVKRKYCQVNKEGNLYSANGTFNPSLLPNKGENMQKKACVRNRVEVKVK